MARHNQDGFRAEEQVSEYLAKSGYKVLARNWRTKWCEVDIIAQKSNCVYFVEVKYRTNAGQGSGFDYITKSKLHKMDLAARSWVELNGWKGEHTLSVAEVGGPDFAVEFIEDILS